MKNNVPAARKILSTDTNSQPMDVQMRKVDSSNIKKVGYRSATRELFVDFQSGAYYRFRGVPQDAFDDFINADSIGEYFAAHIRDEYKFSRRRNRKYEN